MIVIGGSICGIKALIRSQKFPRNLKRAKPYAARLPRIRAMAMVPSPMTRLFVM